MQPKNRAFSLSLFSVLPNLTQFNTHTHRLVANIMANLIAFMAFLAFLDAVLAWIGDMVDIPELSFKVGTFLS